MTSQRSIRAGEVAMLAALVTVVVGTFLPWLASGRVTRNSYSAGGLLRRVGELPGGVGWVMDVWAFVPLLCALGAALTLLGRPAIAAFPAGLGATLAGSVAGFVLADSGTSVVEPVFSGPLVTLIGSCVILVIVMIAIVGVWVPRR